MCLGKAQACIKQPKEEKKVSLLKPYTNYDKIKDMSVDELADFLFKVNNQDFAVDFCDRNYCSEVKEDSNICSGNCQNAIVKYLESEVTE